MGKTLTALLVDDEPTANQGMLKLLAAHPQIHVIGAVNSATEATLLLQAVPHPDVVFLDMEMPSGHGLELLPHLNSAVNVVFVTASENYARKAFDVGAIDYLVKPICAERLQATVQRLTSRTAPGEREESDAEDRAALEGSGAVTRTKEDAGAKKVILPTPNTGFTQLIDINQILWIESMQNYTKVYLRKASVGILLRRKISEWEEMLPAAQFSRLGRSLMVATEQISSTEWRSREETMVYFRDGKAALVISRASAANLKKVLRQTT